MDKADLVAAVDEALAPLGFKRRGNNWSLSSPEVEKMVQLQRSNFGKQYYINYGFNFKALDYDKVVMHIFRRLGLPEQTEEKRLSVLLDLENPTECTVGRKDLVQLLKAHLLPELNGINNEKEAIENLRKRPHTNDVPIVVKKYLGLDV